MKLLLTLSATLIVVFGAAGQVEDFSSVNFNKADSVARLYPDHSLENFQILADKLTSPFSTHVEKFRAIYTWVCLNIKSDYALFKKQKVKRKKLQHNAQALDTWNQKFSVEVIRTLKKHNRTLCTGYAYLLRELANKAGINCAIVNGYGRTAVSNLGGSGTPNHSWNVVQLNGKWYLCDPTWSSGAYDARRNKYVANYNDVYFLLDPALFVRNHYPLDTTHMLLVHKPTLSEFLNRPLIYANIFNYNLSPTFPAQFDITTKKSEAVSFQFATAGSNNVQKIELQIKSLSETYTVSPELHQGSDHISFSHAFSMKGYYTVHMLLEGKYAVTWRLRVM